MKTINLRDYYPEVYRQDMFMEVEDTIAEAFIVTKRIDANYLRRLFYNKAHYSLDQGDGIENAAVRKEPDTADVFEQEETKRELWAAMRQLTPTQQRRVYKYFFEKKTMADIGREENVHATSIKKSIAGALRKMEVYLTLSK